MITRCNLPDSITLKCGTVLKPVIGGHLDQKPFLTKEYSKVDVTQNGWGSQLMQNHPYYYEHTERKLIISEAKRQKLKYRIVSVLGRNLRGKNDLRGREYSGTVWVFVQV